jgi:hypothetical protein
MELEMNEFVKRDINHGPYHHLNKSMYNFYPLNFKNTITSILSTSNHLFS